MYLITNMDSFGTKEILPILFFKDPVLLLFTDYYLLFTVVLPRNHHS